MKQYVKGKLYFITLPSLFQSLYYKFMQTTQFPEQQDSTPEGAYLNPSKKRSVTVYVRSVAICSGVCEKNSNM